MNIYLGKILGNIFFDSPKLSLEFLKPLLLLLELRRQSFSLFAERKDFRIILRVNSSYYLLSFLLDIIFDTFKSAIKFELLNSNLTQFVSDSIHNIL